VSSKNCYSTIDHVNVKDRVGRFDQLRQKWPRWRISDSEHKWLDFSNCQFLGNGRHEIVVFSFERHVRLSRQTGNLSFPVWFSIGQHFSDRWHDANGVPYKEIPAIATIRGIGDRAGFLEPLRMLAVISCSNGQFVFDNALLALAERCNTGESHRSSFGNTRCRRLNIETSTLLAIVGEVLKRPCPPIEPIEPVNADACVSISFDDVVEAAIHSERFVNRDCPIRGAGGHLVYAYTFNAIQKSAELGGEETFPVKIGQVRIFLSDTTTPVDALAASNAAEGRIRQQLPFPEPVSMLGILLCGNGREMESKIHRRLKDRKVKCLAREWFLTNGPEILALFDEYKN
jgi:hypothetical protein